MTHMHEICKYPSYVPYADAGMTEPGGTVCSNGFYADIWSQRQVQQYKSCLKSFLQVFGSFEVP